MVGSLENLNCDTWGDIFLVRFLPPWRQVTKKHITSVWSAEGEHRLGTEQVWRRTWLYWGPHGWTGRSPGLSGGSQGPRGEERQDTVNTRVFCVFLTVWVLSWLLSLLPEGCGEEEDASRDQRRVWAAAAWKGGKATAATHQPQGQWLVLGGAQSDVVSAMGSYSEAVRIGRNWVSLIRSQSGACLEGHSQACWRCLKRRQNRRHPE